MASTGDYIYLAKKYPDALAASLALEVMKTECMSFVHGSYARLTIGKDEVVVFLTDDVGSAAYALATWEGGCPSYKISDGLLAELVTMRQAHILREDAYRKARKAHLN